MNLKVLVIDDNVPSAETLMWAMEAMGNEVQCAYNGAEALKKVRNFVPDVVLCDINMPKIQGYEVCMKMKADPRLADTLFIAQTGLDSARSRELTKLAGFKHHLVKPIDINELFELVALESPLLDLPALIASPESLQK